MEKQKPFHKRHLWEISIFWDIVIIVLLYHMIRICYSIQVILIPAFVGVFFAYLTNPLIEKLQKKHLPRVISVILLIAVTIVIFAGILFFIAPQIKEQTLNLVNNLPKYLDKFTKSMNIKPELIIENSREQLQKIRDNPSSFFKIAGNILGATTQTIFGTGFMIAFFFFFGWRFDSILNSIKRYLPSRHKNRIITLMKKMDTAFGDFFRGRILLSIIIGVLFSIGWALAGVPYWFLLGMVTGFLSIVPYVSAIGWLASILLIYLEKTTGQNSISWIQIIVWPTVVFTIVNILEEWILTPWIQSKSTDLSAFTIFAVVLIGGALWGLFGLLFAIPITACCKILVRELVLPGYRENFLLRR